MKEVAIIGVGIHKFAGLKTNPTWNWGKKRPKWLCGTRICMERYANGLPFEDVLPATSGARILKPLGATGIPICDIEAACASAGSP